MPWKISNLVQWSEGGGEYHGGVNGIPVNLNVNITNEIDTIIVTLPIVYSKPMCIANK